MKPIYNFKINDSKVKNIFLVQNVQKKIFFTWLQRLTIAQTPA